MDTLNMDDLVKIRIAIEGKLGSASKKSEYNYYLNLMRSFKLATNLILRLGAIWSLKLQHIDLENRVIKIRANKDLDWSNKKFK